MSGTYEIFDQKTKHKTMEAVLDSCFGGKNSMSVMTFLVCFFFPLKPSMSPTVPSAEEIEAVPSGQGRNQGIASLSARLWCCTVQELRTFSLLCFTY